MSVQCAANSLRPLAAPSSSSGLARNAFLIQPCRPSHRTGCALVRAADSSPPAASGSSSSGAAGDKAVVRSSCARPQHKSTSPFSPSSPHLAAGMQAAARRGAAAAAAASARFHTTAAALSKSTPRIRFNVREKRTDAKSALKNILLNGGPCQERSNKQQMRQQKVGGRSKARSGSGNNPYSKDRRGIDWRNFDDDDSSDSPYGSFGGKTSFTWYWPGEDDDDLGSTPNGFQWRDEPRPNKSRTKFWNESDVDEEEAPRRDDLKSHRISLGLPALGPLKLDNIKSAFRASALKWHPDKHQGSSQAEAEEKFRRCVEAYNTLSGAFKRSS